MAPTHQSRLPQSTVVDSLLSSLPSTTVYPVYPVDGRLFSPQGGRSGGPHPATNGKSVCTFEEASFIVGLLDIARRFICSLIALVAQQSGLWLGWSIALVGFGWLVDWFGLRNRGWLVWFCSVGSSVGFGWFGLVKLGGWWLKELVGSFGELAGFHWGEVVERWEER